MKQYCISFLFIILIALGIASGTTYAAELNSNDSHDAATLTTSPTTPSTSKVTATSDSVSDESSTQTTSETPSQSNNADKSSETVRQEAKPTQASTLSTDKATTQVASTQNNVAIQEAPAHENTASDYSTEPDKQLDTEKTPSATSTDNAQVAHRTSKADVTSQSKDTVQTSQASTQQPKEHKSTQSTHQTLSTTQESKNTNNTTHNVAPSKKAETTSSNTTTTHTILHTNDIHGRFVEDEGRVIGMAKLKGLKDKYHPDLMVDSGDAFQGLPVSNNSKGEEMAKAMNGVGYDAMTIGNHEFDFGYDQLLKLQKQLNFPMVSSNIYKNGKLIFDPSTIVTKNNVRYGIVGVTTPETKTKTSPTSVEGVEFKDPLPSVSQAMNAIKDNVDVFVILSHLGIDKSTKEQWRGDYLIDQLTKSGSFKQPIFVLDGHSHTVIEQGKHYGANNILAQTGTALENVGRVDFNFQNEPTASLINVADTKDVVADSHIATQTKKANDAFLKETSTVVIPNNTVTLNGEREVARTQETNLGNLITDAMEAYATKNFSHAPDFAITNGGGIRASINKGKVTENDIITVLPFGNLISQIKVKGSDVEKAFELSLGSRTDAQEGKTVLAANGGFLQVSDSIRVYFDINKEAGHRVNAIKVLNKDTGGYEDLDPNRIYYVTTNDFTANQGDDYDMFGGEREEGISLDAVVVQYMNGADLSKYDTNEPVRIINGEPDSNTQPNTHAEDTNHQPTTDNGDDKVIEFPIPHKKQDHPAVEVIAHASTSSENETSKGYDSHKANASNKGINVIQFPSKRKDGAISSYPQCTLANYATKPKMPNNIRVAKAMDNCATINTDLNLLVSQASYSNNAKNTANMLNEDYYGSKHHNITQLPNTGKNNMEHDIAILLVVIGAGLVYSRKRKKSA
ncbi:bifunctional metallophosphatase/5'-nucleotidase [Staphylococcus devriesei]|uniref:5'-nucleotidase C-terminal domain-containing protein n=1 Tax=Staphylococcus devriesei TaxID=586733 RepID=UPI000D1CA423|nr:5'-nucleotidase C-terminal domain-containing protein [Staphylococcus devriesei]PTF05235.1 bifunctional metallophosphatase/5'-nucleotidase [Staphylococcus devriesei]